MSNVPTLHSQEYILFSSHLRATLEKSGYTQTQLAEMLNKPQSYVSKCLSRERRMGIVELYKMCRVIDISLTDLVRDIEEMFDEIQHPPLLEISHTPASVTDESTFVSP